MEDRQTCLLIDGHNVIHAWEDLARLHKKGEERYQAREELTRRVSDYSALQGWHCVVVFDGQGPKTQHSEWENRKGLQVIYCQEGRTADDVIETLVRKYASKYQLFVVTGDYREQNQVIAGGADVMSPEHFRAELEGRSGEIDRYRH